MGGGEGFVGQVLGVYFRGFEEILESGGAGQIALGLTLVEQP